MKNKTKNPNFRNIYFFILHTLLVTNSLYFFFDFLSWLYGDEDNNHR